jgi:site-specific recombinase XerD
LDLSSVDLNERIVFVRAGKGGKDRTALLSHRACRAVGRYLEEARPSLLKGRPGNECQRLSARRQNLRASEQALWIAARGNFLTEHGMRLVFRQWAIRLNRRFTPHMVRHAFACHLLRCGADLMAIKALLGHSSIETTRIYTRMVKADVKTAYDRAMPRFRFPLPNRRSRLCQLRLAKRRRK